MAQTRQYPNYTYILWKGALIMLAKGLGTKSNLQGSMKCQQDGERSDLRNLILDIMSCSRESVGLLIDNCLIEGS